MKKILIPLFILSVSITPAFAQNNDKVMLCESWLYLGKKAYLGPGNYERMTFGIGDNKLSSFHIPDGMAMQVFEYDRFLGRSETFYSSVSSLPSSWNDKVSSIKIFWVHDPGNPGGGSGGNNLPPQGDRVIFYRDMKYSGMSREMNTGSFSTGDLGFLSGQISSIYIPYGLSVNVNDNSGRSYLFANSQSTLSQYGWDNKIISGTIQNSGSGGGNTLPPQGDKMIFYGDIKYSGMSRDFNNGSFSSSDLGFLSQNISSIYIPPGKTVRVHDSRNNSRTFTASVSDLGQYGWNDKIYTGVISGGSSGTLPPQGDKVIFYRDMKYSGMAKEFNYGLIGNNSLGFLSNNISSMYIPFGWSVEVRDNRGHVQTFTTSISNLAQYGWDNRIHSCTIRNNSGGGQGGNNGGNVVVDLYNDANYQGNVTNFKEGMFSSLGFGVDNNISSIRLPSGFAITIYDGPNLTGNNRTFTASVPNLSVYGWNDKISSVYVFRQ